MRLGVMRVPMLMLMLMLMLDAILSAGSNLLFAWLAAGVKTGGATELPPAPEQA